MNAREQILIDYGGGTGLVSLPLAPLVKQLQIWDTAEGMLAIVDQKVTQQRADKCFWITPRFNEGVHS